MLRFLCLRVALCIPTLIAVSLIVFLLVSLAPGDPFGEVANDPSLPPAEQAVLRRQYGLDDPLPVQYGKWASQWVRGNWGISLVGHISVAQLIRQRLGTTLLVLGLAYVLAVLIAVPVGVLAAVRQHSILDYLVTLATSCGFALPTFCTGLLFILIFTVKLHWLPEIYTTNVSGTGLRTWLEILQHAAPPVIVLALAEGAALTRYVRVSVLEVIQLDYVRTARAKGLSEVVVTVRHALRNALIPVVTVMALQVPGIFTGAVIVEQIFRVPGIGTLLLSSIQAKDISVIMAIVLVFALLVVLCNLLADTLYGVLDPRITNRS